MNLSEYTWPRPPGFTPFEHQKTTSEFLTINRKAFCFNEQGTGKDIDHAIPLSKGGTNAPSNLKLKSPSANRSFSRNSDHTVKVNKPKKKK